MSKYHQLSEGERYTIAFCSKRGVSKTEIASLIGRHPSTIYREIKRNVTHHDGWYRAFIAHEYAVARRRRERRGSQYSEDEWAEVIELLRRNYSPEQISGVLREQGLLCISHETIYQYILRDQRQGGTLHKHLRIKIRRHRKRGAKHQKRAIIAGKRLISTRPKSVERRTRIGHWEADTMVGTDRRHCIVTLVERKTGFAVIKKVHSRTIPEVNRAFLDAIITHRWRFRSITFDNGIEFQGWKELEAKFPIKCYFANPYHSWERGINENLNGLIRQYIPKGTCMKNISQNYCDWIAEELNSRPRKRHGYRTPKELFYAA